MIKTNTKIKTLEEVTPHWKIIEEYVRSKKDKENVFDIIRFVGDDEIQELRMPNSVLRTKNSEGDMRRGQLDFCFVTKDEQLLDLDFFHQYQGRLREQLSYYHKAQSIKFRYDLEDLKGDLKEIHQDMELLYVILSSPHMSIVNVLTFNQLTHLFIDVNKISDLPYFGEEDDIDKENEREMKVLQERNKEIQERIDRGEEIFFCPACGEEWNNDYCHYCGHPH